MKKYIFLLLGLALALLAGIQAYAQDLLHGDQPAFYKFTPGIYINGWPRFTITYPKDWVERRPMQQETFRASAPGDFPDAW